MILDLYSHLNQNGQRFVDEVFVAEIYSRCKPKLTVVDLGAFNGEFAYYCLPFADAVYCVEPDPGPYTKMVEIIEKFKLEDKIFTFPIAISGKDGKRHFNVNGGGGGTLLGQGNDKGLEIDTLTLNSFLKREGLDKVDILKIDVESAEGEIFSAPDFQEAADKIKYIIGEPHTGEQVRPFLENAGFKVNFWPESIFTATK